MIQREVSRLRFPEPEFALFIRLLSALTDGICWPQCLPGESDLLRFARNLRSLPLCNQISKACGVGIVRHVRSTSNRSHHGITTCPYCYEIAPDLTFVSKEQRIYLTACYEAFARAFLHKKSTSVDMADISDERMAWHYSEVKQQFHFVCQTNGCKCQTDILGQYGYCPRCGLSNARAVFFQAVDNELARLEVI